MGDNKGGSADSSGMMQAMASAQAADKAYQLGEQQLQWAQDTWNQEQPLMDASEQQQMALSAEQQASLEQSQAESAQQWDEYQDVYQPLEEKYAGQAANWDSQGAQAEARGQAMGSVASSGQASLNAAAETLRGYGINPGSGRYAGLYASAQPMLGAAEAAAGTTASNNLKAQQMELESGAINTGRNLVNSTGTLTGVGTQAGSAGSSSAAGAANTANTDLTTGSTAMTSPSSWFNSGNGAMDAYVGAVNGYNQSNASFAQANASEVGGIGSAVGGLTGLAIWHEKGGAVGYEQGGGVDPTRTPAQGGGMTGIPGAPMIPMAGGGIPPRMPPRHPADATPGGTVPAHASPSHGVATDDVPAMLTANEFVIPKDVATWLGHKHLANTIDKARAEQHQFSNRDDIGGEPSGAIPQRPTFVSRPAGA